MSATILDSAAHARGERLLREARGSIRNAFAALDLGWTYDDVWDYLEGSPAFQTLPEDRRAICAGMVMGFALVAVERARVLGGREHRITYGYRSGR